MIPPFEKYSKILIASLGPIGLIPIGFLAMWSFTVSGDYYEYAIVQEFEQCTTITDCKVPQQCRINATVVKNKYLEELNGPITGLLYKAADYPTIKVGFPAGSDDDFPIPKCEPSLR